MVGRNLLCHQEVTEARATELHLGLEAGGAPGEVAWGARLAVAGCFGLSLEFGLWLAWSFWVLDATQC